MANGALSGGGVEGEIRKKIIEDDLVYGIVACPPKLFYNVSLPVSLWFLRKSKPGYMKRRVLFIYAKKTFKPISRRQVVLSEEHITKIAEKFRVLEKEGPEDRINEVGFAKVETLKDVAKNGYVLTPGRYVGIKMLEEELTFEDKMRVYSEELAKLLREEEELTGKVKKVYKSLNFKV